MKLSKQKQQEMAQDVSGSPLAQLRAQLNGAKVIAPLLNALLQQPGLDKDSESLQEATVEVTGLHRKATEKVLQVLQPNDNHPAAKAVIAEPLAKLVATSWVNDSSKVDPDAIADMFLQAIDLQDPQPSQVFDTTLPRATDLAIAEGRAVSKLVPTLLKVGNLKPGAQRLFIGSQSLTDVMDLTKADLVKMASRISAKLMPAEDVDEKQKSITYRSVLSTMSTVYAETIGVEASRLFGELKTLNAEQKKAFLQQVEGSEAGILVDRTRESVGRSANAIYPMDFKAQDPESKDSNSSQMGM